MIKTVVLCGRTCAGKTTGGDFLATKLGFRHVEASSIMRELWSAAAHGSSLDDFAGRLIIEAPERVPTKALGRSSGMPLVITGLRSPKEVMEVRRLRVDVRVIFIEAGAETRLERSVRRARQGHPRTSAELLLLDQIHERMGLEKIATDASTVTLRNECSVERYHEMLALAVS